MASTEPLWCAGNVSKKEGVYPVDGPSDRRRLDLYSH
jgi:hypothetical protein